MKKLEGFEIELGDLWEYKPVDSNGAESANKKKGVFLIVSLCEGDSLHERNRVLGFHLKGNEKLNYYFSAVKEHYSLILRNQKD